VWAAFFSKAYLIEIAMSHIISVGLLLFAINLSKMAVSRELENRLDSSFRGMVPLLFSSSEDQKEHGEMMLGIDAGNFNTFYKDYIFKSRSS